MEEAVAFARTLSGLSTDSTVGHRRCLSGMFSLRFASMPLRKARAMWVPSLEILRFQHALFPLWL